jgi:hypothetical protein
MRLRCLISCCWPLTFGRAYFLSVAVLLLFVLWIVFDASFHWIPPLVGQDIRLQFLSDPSVSSMHGWDLCGPRLLVFAILALVGLTATVMVFVRSFIGSEAERSIRSLLLATALVAFWLSLFVSYNQLWWVGFRYRILRQHNAMKASVVALSQHWPTGNVALPELGCYVPSGHDPDLLYIDDGKSSFMTNFTEVFDRIGRSKKGDFSFAIQSCPGWWVHYMIEGRSPQSHKNALPGTGLVIASWKLQYVTEFHKDWYLAQYEITVEDASTSSANGKQIQAPLPASQKQ